MDIKNGQVEVDEARNQSTMGPKGTRSRSADSCYLFVGGSSDTYSVTINFTTGHWCAKDHTGEKCNGNNHGKGQKYGSIGERDPRDTNQWCKHVAAALRATDMIAEAQDITAAAFGAKAPAKTVAPKAKRSATVAPAPIRTPAPVTSNLATLAQRVEAADALVEELEIKLAEAQKSSRDLKAAIIAALQAA